METVIAKMLDVLKDDIVDAALNINDKEKLARIITNIFIDAENRNENSSAIQITRLLQGLELSGSIAQEDFQRFDSRISNIFALINLD
ncbi:hypothetical protein [Pseudomonas syringae group genomosp. 3]|uniref:hypothetical protein n=1 Tax=Pseudomonas syringae group genomosp. 3 TaxID=251701 RepID=UPI0006B88B91|nr:hypothetical protein [Pseudomonas syringae group genomosp. 3]KPB82028.1 Unknown protein sequence [Pseudomonas syringae pv. maculicola]